MGLVRHGEKGGNWRPHSGASPGALASPALCPGHHPSPPAPRPPAAGRGLQDKPIQPWPLL